MGEFDLDNSRKGRELRRESQIYAIEKHSHCLPSYFLMIMTITMNVSMTMERYN